jgi:hypothetical protein
MPVPDVETIREIGKMLDTKEKTPTDVERAVGDAIGLPKRLIQELCE